MVPRCGQRSHEESWYDIDSQNNGRSGAVEPRQRRLEGQKGIVGPLRLGCHLLVAAGSLGKRERQHFVCRSQLLHIEVQFDMHTAEA
jgi:hypothetical protein